MLHAQPHEQKPKALLAEKRQSNGWFPRGVPASLSKAPASSKCCRIQPSPHRRALWSRHRETIRIQLEQLKCPRA